MNRTTALATHLSNLSGWRLLAHCARCRQIRVKAVTDRGQSYPSHLISDVVPRLRCMDCGNPSDRVKPLDGAHGAMREAGEAMLVGSERRPS